MSYIHKVGFEIEGGWNGTPGVSPFKDITLVREGSINGQTLGAALPIQATHIGEAVSPPLPYSSDWEEWLTSHWPDADPPHRTNRTCGFHIHLSTHSMKDYALLGSKTFLFSLVSELSALGKRLKLHERHVFWERMQGFNTFCDLQFDPAQQMRVKRKGGRNRYGWLNFAWSLHKTVEFRALPTFRDAKIAVQFAKAYFDHVEEWLEANKHVELKRSTSISA